ncbi:MAG: inositol monophosphatase family protein [Anaerolineae bacterium]
MELQNILTFTEALARTAGDVVMSYFDKPIKQSYKSGPYDVVTEADKAAEVVIVDAIRAAYPDHHLVGEEGGGQGAPIAEAPYHWYIDPIDGTANYANKIPHFAISIGMTDKDMNPLVGVIYQPVANEMYSAALGLGTKLNHAPVQVSAQDNLEYCVVASGFRQGRSASNDPNLARWGRMLETSRGIRRSGSAALDLAYVAVGRYEAYWQTHLKPWDLMAGVLLVTEAGGRVTNYAGQTESSIVAKGEVLASNGFIHDQVLRVINGVV